MPPTAPDSGLTCSLDTPLSETAAAALSDDELHARAVDTRRQLAGLSPDSEAYHRLRGDLSALNNVEQNRQARAAAQKAGLSRQKQRAAHDALTRLGKEGESLSFDELVEFFSSFVN